MTKKKKIKKTKKIKKDKKIKSFKKAKPPTKKLKDTGIKKVGSFVNNSEEKIEIKKIKKQPTEKKQYSVKDYVVYPKHGVGKIVSVEKAKIGDIEIQFYKIFIEKEKLTLTVPINQQSNLRNIATINRLINVYQF